MRRQMAAQKVGRGMGESELPSSSVKESARLQRRCAYRFIGGQFSGVLAMQQGCVSLSRAAQKVTLLMGEGEVVSDHDWSSQGDLTPSATPCQVMAHHGYRHVGNRS